jgi:heme/copper-type cytochrome/quinol oxidase subunit 2
MNKYLSLLIFGTLLMVSGFVYQQFYRPANVGGANSTGKVVEIQMRVLKDQWKWDPDTIRVNPGDKVKLSIYNEDSYDHGFAIDVLGINKRIFPKSTAEIEFTPQVSGTFNYYCSVPCGKGHYDQIGTLIVGKGEGAGVEISMIHKENFACKK